MNKKPHKLLDRPILGYFLLFVLAQICITLGSNIDTAVSPFIPGYGKEVTVYGMTRTQAAGFGSAVGALAAILVFTLWFRPDYKKPFSLKNFSKGLLMLLPFLIIHYAGSAVSMITFGTSSVLLAFLKAMAPGFGEETAFRILGISNYMRTIRSENEIKKIFWLSSIFFGVFHLANLFSGADLFATLFQAVYCVGVGMILGAVYLRTGNIWIIMLGHMSLDFLEFCRGDLGASGVVMSAIGIGDWITMAAAVAGAVIALRLVDKKYYPEITELWNRKWHRQNTI
ncbi:MAG: CPBP family intramembrane metalloprotease [Oscillospiraceae bacterium]|nr:CPBP family intramembrane metalloprotease [Oscillospiraceae bacterium]